MNTPESTLPLDATNTHVSFHVRWFGVVPVRGSFGSVEGLLEGGGPREDPAVAVKVESQSVRTGIGLRDRHLRGMRFLDSVKHPRIVFVSRSVCRHNGALQLKGTLSLRGLDRTVTVSVRDERASATERLLTAAFSVPRHPHAIGTANGIRRLNPLLWAIGREVQVRVEILVPTSFRLSVVPANPDHADRAEVAD